MSFDWQTDEEDETIWQDEALLPRPTRTREASDPAQTAKSAFTFNRRWLWLLLPLVIGITFWRVTSWSGEQIETRENTITQDIDAMFDQFYLAAATQDAEIAQPLLHRRDYNWASQQTRMIISGDFIHRHPFDLTAVTDPPPQLTIDLAPDQQTAVISWPQPYKTSTNQTVTLTQTQYTTRISGRWQLAPLPDDYWGNFATDYIDQGLELSFYETDRALSEQLLTHINEANVCTRTYALEWCADGGKFGHKQLHLSNNLETLYMIWGNELIYHGRRPAVPVTLPSPTLIGLPADQASTQYLVDGYIAQHRIASEALRVNCCTLFAQAMLNRHLHHEGLRPWPYEPADYATYFESPLPPNRWFFWSMPDEDQTDRTVWEVHLLASYIYDKAPTQWQQITNDLANRNIRWEELPPFVKEISLSSTTADFTPWLDYLSTQADTPLGLQAQQQQNEDIQLLCRSDLFEEESNRWLQFTTQGTTNINAPSTPTNNKLYPLANGDGYIWYEQPDTLTIYAKEKEPVSLYLKPIFSDLRFTPQPFTSPQQKHIVLTALPEQPGDKFRYYQVSRDQCRTTIDSFCPFYMLDGLPTWNKSETHALQSDGTSPIPQSLEVTGSAPDPTPITLATANGRPLLRLGDGQAPFWLDEQTFGFAQQIKHSASTQTDIFTGTIDSNTLTPWLTWGEIEPQLPERYATTFYFVQHIAPLPQSPHIVMIAFNTSQAEGIEGLSYLGNTHLLFYDQQTKQWLPSLVLDRRAEAYDWSPNGRWLHIEATFGQSYIIDLQTREITNDLTSFPDIVQWSPDGSQLLQAHIGFLTLTDPATQQLSVLPYPENSIRCTTGGYLGTAVSANHPQNDESD